MTQRHRSVSHAHLGVRRTTGVALAATACLLVAACSTNPGRVPAKSTDSVPSPTRSTAPALTAADAARAQVLVAYQGYWRIQETAFASGSLDGLPINAYAVGQAASGIRSALDYYQSQHLVVRGKPGLNPKVTSVDLVHKPYSAALTDCIDTSTFLPVDATTGKPAMLENSQYRHVWTFTATFDNVHWYINSGQINRSTSC